MITKQQIIDFSRRIYTQNKQPTHAWLLGEIVLVAEGDFEFCREFYKQIVGNVFENGEAIQADAEPLFLDEKIVSKNNHDEFTPNIVGNWNRINNNRWELDGGTPRVFELNRRIAESQLLMTRDYTKLKNALKPSVDKTDWNELYDEMQDTQI